MRVSREKAEELLEELKNVVSVMDCIHATDSEIVDDTSDDYYSDVEISVSSCAGDGMFILKMGSPELKIFREALIEAEAALKYNLEKSCGVDID